MNRPNFFIVGAARAGTTSLWRCLKQHPEVFMPADILYKEPAFFSDKAPQWSSAQYLNLFQAAKAGHRRIGEASTAYLSDPGAAYRIHSFNPGAQIIILLRAPVDRAYSLYNWMVQEGYEYARCFEKALALEPYRAHKRIPNFWAPEYYWNYMYFRSGLYYRQVKRYLNLFDDRVLLVAFDDWKSDPDCTLNRVYRFLGLAPLTVRPRTYNRSYDVRHPLIQFGLRKVNRSANLVRRRLIGHAIQRKKDRDFLIRIGWKPTLPTGMHSGTRRRLERAYVEDIRRLNDMTGLHLAP